MGKVKKLTGHLHKALRPERTPKWNEDKLQKEDLLADENRRIKKKPTRSGSFKGSPSGTNETYPKV